MGDRRAELESWLRALVMEFEHGDLTREKFDAEVRRYRSTYEDVDAPKRVGLCPGEHLHEFYMPLDPDSDTICPQCSLRMVVYEPVDERRDLFDALRLVVATERVLEDKAEDIDFRDLFERNFLKLVGDPSGDYITWMTKEGAEFVERVLKGES